MFSVWIHASVKGIKAEDIWRFCDDFFPNWLSTKEIQLMTIFFQTWFEFTQKKNVSERESAKNRRGYLTMKEHFKMSPALCLQFPETPFVFLEKMRCKYSSGACHIDKVRSTQARNLLQQLTASAPRESSHRYKWCHTQEVIIHWCVWTGAPGFQCGCLLAGSSQRKRRGWRELKGELSCCIIARICGIYHVLSPEYVEMITLCRHNVLCEILMDFRMQNRFSSPLNNFQLWLWGCGDENEFWQRYSNQSCDFWLVHFMAAWLEAALLESHISKAPVFLWRFHKAMNSWKWVSHQTNDVLVC